MSRHSRAINVIITTNLYFDNKLVLQTSITQFNTLLLYNNTSSTKRGYQEHSLCSTIKILERKEKIVEESEKHNFCDCDQPSISFGKRHVDPDLTRSDDSSEVYEISIE